MPIYEYRCAECHAEFEVWQKMSDKPVHKCEKCGSRKVSKLISQTSFQLKGTGWYVTDYGRKDAGGTSSKVKPDAPKSEAKKESAPACGSGSGSKGGGCGGGACGTN